jgi:predicted RNase H-like nuclease (RuvC/YqgF family)
MGVPRLYLVELHFRGVGKALSHSPEERVVTSIYRLSREERNRLQYLKVKFYRLLDRHCTFKLRDKYVLSLRGLAAVEKGFQQIHGEFTLLRAEIYNRLVAEWPRLSGRLREYAAKFGIPEERVEQLRPGDPEEFLEMGYSVTPLPQLLEQLRSLAEEFGELAGRGEEYRLLAERVEEEAEDMVMEMRLRYEEKVRELEETVERLRKALKLSEQKRYELQLRAGELAEEAGEIADLLGGETLEDLKFRLNALKGYFAG